MQTLKMDKFVCISFLLFDNNRGKGFEMAVGHRIIEPSGKVSVVMAENHESVAGRVNSL